MGAGALLTNVSGGNNTGLGSFADVSTSALTMATAVGAYAAVNANNKVRIGASTVTCVEGQVAYTFPSDGRFKFNVKEEVKGLDFIMKLRPVLYHFDTKKFDEFLMKNMPDSVREKRMKDQDYKPSTNIVHTGFIAQEVEKAAKECGFTFDGVSAPQDENGNYGIAYSQFTVPLVKAVQELSNQNKELLGMIKELQKKNAEMKHEIDALKKK
jgi:trimeric autotransporter adhesin